MNIHVVFIISVIVIPIVTCSLISWILKDSEDDRDKWGGE